MKMISAKLQLPENRIVALVGVIVLLVALTVGVLLWRFDMSSASDQRALTASQAQVYVEKTRLGLARQVALVDAYRVDKDPADLRALSTVQSDLRTAGLGLLRLIHGPVRSSVVSIGAAVLASDATLTHVVVPVASTPQFERAVKPFEQQLLIVSNRLDVLAGAFGAQAATASMAARRDSASPIFRTTKWLGVLAFARARVV